MKQLIFTTLLITIALFAGCSTSNPGAIKIDLSKADDITLDELGLKAEMQLLKFPNDSIFIGQVAHVDYSDKYIYVVEFKTCTIFQFNRQSGEYIRSVNKIGRAGDEYGYITDIKCHNNKIYICDPNKQKTWIYDEDLNSIGELNICGRDILKIDSDGIYYNNPTFEKGDADIVKIDFQNDTIQQWFIRDKESPNGFPIVEKDANNLFTYNNEIYISPLYSRELFKIENDTLAKVLEFDFGSDNMPSTLRYEFIQKINESPAAIPTSRYIVGDILTLIVEMGSIESPIVISEDFNSISVNTEATEEKTLYTIAHNLKTGETKFGKVLPTTDIEFKPQPKQFNNAMICVHSIIDQDIELYRPYLTNIATSDKLKDGDIILVYYSAK